VQYGEIGGRGPLFAGKLHGRSQGHDSHCKSALRIALHHSDRFVRIAVDAIPLAGGQREKPEHVTARERGDKGFFGIDGRRFGPGRRHVLRRCGPQCPGSSVKRHRVLSTVALAWKISLTPFPEQLRCIGGHGFSIQYQA
jgi:hypothetical protein